MEEFFEGQDATVFRNGIAMCESSALVVFINSFKILFPRLLREA